jgi:porin
MTLVVAATGGASARADGDAQGRHVLGDWGGLRTRLADQGLAFQFEYGSQVAHNFTGGVAHLTRYADQWTVGMSANLDKIWGWKGGTLQATVTDRNGRNLGADAQIGNSMLVQEIYGRGQTWHLTQFWLNQDWFDDRLQVKLGRLTLGEDFATFPCDFQNLTFCGSQPGNLVSNYWVNWPTSQWAMRVKYQASQLYAQVGAYQVNPRYLDDGYARRSGWKLDNPGGTTGALIPIEFGWSTVLGGHPGLYKVGGWYNTSRGQDLYYDVDHNSRGTTGLSPLERSGQYGGYVSFQQQITGADSARGASVFFNVSAADRNTAMLDRQVVVGMTYQGPFGRARDAVGLAAGATHSNARFADFVRDYNARTQQRVVAGNGNEYAVELYYSWAPTPGVYLRPNIQYLVHPGGTSQNQNATVVGLKSGVSF